jgi:uncharacterized protein (UPF0262 family)
LVKNYFQLVKNHFLLVKNYFQLVKNYFLLVKNYFQLVKNHFLLVKNQNSYFTIGKHSLLLYFEIVIAIEIDIAVDLPF